MRSKLALLIASLSVAALAAGATGCKKTTTPPDNSADNADAQLGARDYFIAKVFPQMSKGCANNCHGSGGVASTFLAATGEQSYQLITDSIGLIAEPSKSPLVQHEHSDQTIVLTPEQRTVITQWLNMEATARGLAGSVQKAPTIQAAYKAYADCMNFDMWEYYRVGDLPFSQTDIDGPCMGCHSIGQGSAWLSAGSRETFEKAKEFPFIQKFVVGKVDKNGNFDSLVPAGRFADKADEPCPDGKTDCHPSFGLPPNVANAVDNFTTATLENVASGTCGQPFVVPRDAGPADAADGGGK
jgi:hypothetical protein